MNTNTESAGLSADELREFADNFGVSDKYTEEDVDFIMAAVLELASIKDKQTPVKVTDTIEDICDAAYDAFDDVYDGYNLRRSIHHAVKTVAPMLVQGGE